ncbi:MAG TPA: hypothetical protein VI413_00900 [Paludibacter sp.]
MILGYMKYWPWGGFTNFAQKIIRGWKKHTMRIDKNNRWKPGMKIQHAHGVRTKDYMMFFQGECKSVQKVEIIVSDKFDTDTYIMSFHPKRTKYFIVKIDDRKLTNSEIIVLATNDGFDSVHDFFRWFKKGFIGKIIHFTDLRY